jgi:hypothetical protein
MNRVTSTNDLRIVLAASGRSNSGNNQQQHDPDVLHIFSRLFAFLVLFGDFTLTPPAVIPRDGRGMCALTPRLLRSSCGRQSIALAKKSGPISGMSEKSMSSSRIASMRFQSVLDGLFVCCIFVLFCIIQGYLTPPTPLKVQMLTANC